MTAWPALRRALAAVYLSKPVRTFAQTAVALLSVSVMAGGGLEAVDWHNVASVSAAAALLALLQSMADGTSLIAGPPAAVQEDPPLEEWGDDE